MATRRRRLGAAWSLLALLPVAGCTLVDCPDFGDFGPVDVDRASVEAVAPAGPEAVVALVQSAYREETSFYVRSGAEAPVPSTNGTFEVLYRIDGDAYDGQTLDLVAATRGDTVFVYVEGTLDPTIFLPACSPALASYRFGVDGVTVPEDIESVRIVTVDPEDLTRAARAFLQDHEADRRTARRLTA